MGGNVAARNSTEMNEHKQDSQAHSTASITHEGQALSTIMLELFTRAPLGSIVHQGKLGTAGIELKSSAEKGVVKNYLITPKGALSHVLQSLLYQIGSATKKAKVIGSGLILAQSSGGKMTTAGGWTPSVDMDYPSGFMLALYERGGNLIGVTAPAFAGSHLLYYGYVNLTAECGLLPGERVKLTSNTNVTDIEFSIVEV